MDDQLKTICFSCKSVIPTASHFCPNCGKPVAEISTPVGLGKKIVIYSVSLFLPPFGLLYAFKYFKEDNREAKKIAVVAVIITLISIIFTLWATVGSINLLSQSLKEINNINSI